MADDGGEALVVLRRLERAAEVVVDLDDGARVQAHDGHDVVRPVSPRSILDHALAEVEVVVREAEVADDLADNDQGVIPPAVRDRQRPHLIKMAAAGEMDGYQAVLGGVSRVKLAEKGTAKTGPLASAET